MAIPVKVTFWMRDAKIARLSNNQQAFDAAVSKIQNAGMDEVDLAKALHAAYHGSYTPNPTKPASGCVPRGTTYTATKIQPTMAAKIDAAWRFLDANLDSLSDADIHKAATALMAKAQAQVDAAKAAVAGNLFQQIDAI